jgi:hypothetical protein
LQNPRWVQNLFTSFVMNRLRLQLQSMKIVSLPAVPLPELHETGQKKELEGKLFHPPGPKPYTKDNGGVNKPSMEYTHKKSASGSMT